MSEHLTPLLVPVSEARFQAAVVDLARLLGWKVWHVSDSRKLTRHGPVGDKGIAGFPDLVLARDRLLLRELKTEDGRLSVEQQDTLALLAAAGADAAVWRPAMWPVIEAELRRDVRADAA